MRHPSLLAAAVFACAAPAAAQDLTTVPVATGFDTPIWAGPAPGDGSRIFAAEQFTGRIRIHDGNGVLPTPFLDLGGEVAGVAGQQGLLSMAFHPQYAQNGYFYATYTTPSPGSRSVVARYRVSSADPDVADPSSETILLEIDEPAPTHNVEHLLFGPLDGYLYVFAGDGGGPNDPGCDAQRTDNLLGKMLRIDVDSTDPGLEYAIPPDNPFVGQPGHREEIWSLGLRNVWRFGFDRLTGDLLMGDVGQAAREEIDFEPALTGGRNYGWPVMEGLVCNANGIASCASLSPPGCFDAGYTDPAHELVHPDMVVLVGGLVYRGCRIPGLHGKYIYADRSSFSYFTAEISHGQLVNVQDRSSELASAGNAVHFGETLDGEILIVDRTNGRVSQIVPASAPSLTDCDGDGLHDPCELAVFDNADTDGSGVLDSCESLDVDVTTISAGLGGTQALRLHPGAAQAGKLYVVLGSFSGMEPGTPLGFFHLPLNFDFYTLYTLTDANQPPLVATVGVLDGAGEATALFDAAAGGLPPSVVGLTAHHAFAIVDAGNDVDFVSNATSLSFDA